MKPIRKSILEQKAKKIQKQKDIKWSKALDEAAIECGFSNYRNFLNSTNDNVANSAKPKNLYEKLQDLSPEKTQELKNYVNQFIIDVIYNKHHPLSGNILNSFRELDVQIGEHIYEFKNEKLHITGQLVIKIKPLNDQDDMTKSAVLHSDRHDGQFHMTLDSENNLKFESLSLNDDQFWASRKKLI